MSYDLRNIRLFEGLTAQELEKLKPICREEFFPANTVIFTEKDTSDDLYIVLDGQVNIQFKCGEQEGATEVVIHIVSNNACFGWSALVSPQIRAATAKCTKDTRCLVLPGNKLMEIMEQNPHIGNLIMTKIAELVSKRLKFSKSQLISILCEWW